MHIGHYITLFVGLATPAYAIEIAMPVECEMGTKCVVQNYVDHDSAKGDKAYNDFTCGHLSYDGHKGTDIRAVDESVMNTSISVLAVADGVVLGKRDGVKDRAPVIKNQECGNGVRISHADGWTTQYCHMKNGSVTVKKGQKVTTGDVLGKIGLTGNTEFPHVHLSIEKDGKHIDPYSGTALGEPCSIENLKPLWSAEAAKQLAYKPTGLLGGGFTNKEIKANDLAKGLHHNTSLSGKEPVLIFWVNMYGVQRGDTAHLSLHNPSGEVVVEKSNGIENNRATQNYFIGKINKQGWPAGKYTGKLRLERNGNAVIEREFTIMVGA
ncbi:MAG: M23 family metallopeptidase [Alphaproteobacteria bacterium]|nr:M23 family metallopeptidase [Alphaproteobacteria bacterium]